MSKNHQNTASIQQQVYNEFPYNSYPFEYNRPENLRSIATLFGVEAPALENARILEIGCASGGNLYRFAEDYPKSYTLGIDISDKQIEQGKNIVKTLGLKNLELKAMSVGELDEKEQKFDYIICHGVFSWVPEEVREQILTVSKKLLSKHGIAFISYNTLPGWNMASTIRELMMYHANNFQAVNDRISQAKAALSFIQESLEGQQSPHAQYLNLAAKNLAQKDDSYLRHEYLAEENKAFYFHEFIDMARQHQLNYVGDTDLIRMYIGNLPQKAAETLSQITDIVRTEQYIDFVLNTQFRCTLLTHQDQQLSRNITPKVIEKFKFYANIAPATKNDKEINLEDDSAAYFSINNNETSSMHTNAPSMKAILVALCLNTGKPLTIDELVQEAKKLLKNGDEKQLRADIDNNFARLIFNSYIKFTTDAPKTVHAISAKPQVSKLARLQAELFSQIQRPYITLHNNTLMQLQPHQIDIIKNLDGKHSIKQLEQIVYDNIKSGKLNVSIDNKAVTGEEQINIIVTNAVASTLELLKNNFGLVA